MDPVYCPRCAAPLSRKEASGRDRLGCLKEGCGYIFYDNPLPVVAALVVHQGQVVLARGRGWPARMVGLVTGFLERDESPEEGVLRELFEELGLEGEVTSLIGVYPFPLRNEVIIAYEIAARGEVTLGEEIESVKRVDPDKLRPWPFGTGLAVRDWIERRKRPAADGG